MRLGELLIREGQLTREQLREALEAQVLHGGRLGTNLMELGFVTEAVLARALGQQQQCGYASGEMIPDPASIQLVGADFMDTHDVVPMRVDATRLTVAVLSPNGLEALDGLAFQTGRRVVPVIIAEWRMHQLLRRHARAFRPVRALDVQVLKGTLPEKGAPARETSPDLMSEEEFQQLYAAALVGTPADDSDEIIEGEQLAEELPPGPPAHPAVTAAADAGVVLPDDTPLEFAQAKEALLGIRDREEVARTILRFARSRWRRALLLNVQGALLTGWRGLGEGVSPQQIRRIGVTLREQSTFKLVRDLRSHYVGPMRRDAGTVLFYRMLGGGFPTTAVLLPLLVRGRVVHLLYVDDGPGQLTPPDVGELLILSQGVARSYEALIRARQAG